MLTDDRCETDCLHPDVVRPLIGRTLDVTGAEPAAAWFATLADPTRVRIVQALSLADELCVCDLAALLGLSVSGLSHQLRYLLERHVVGRRKVGRVVYYRMADGHVRNVLADALTHAGEASGAPTIVLVSNLARPVAAAAPAELAAPMPR